MTGILACGLIQGSRSLEDHPATLNLTLKQYKFFAGVGTILDKLFTNMSGNLAVIVMYSVIMCITLSVSFYHYFKVSLNSRMVSRFRYKFCTMFSVLMSFN